MANQPGESYVYALLQFPTWKAWVAIALALPVAGLFYFWAGKSLGEYLVKVADYTLQGAIVTLLFASLGKGLRVVLTTTRTSR
jgi:hypothetical protein